VQVKDYMVTGCGSAARRGRLEPGCWTTPAPDVRENRSSLVSSVSSSARSASSAAAREDLPASSWTARSSTTVSGRPPDRLLVRAGWDRNETGCAGHRLVQQPRLLTAAGDRLREVGEVGAGERGEGFGEAVVVPQPRSRGYVVSAGLPVAAEAGRAGGNRRVIGEHVAAFPAPQ
jgi:hypothetical protein